MMDTRTRNPAPDEGWRTSGPRPAGLYGELPPLSAQLPARTALAPRPLRKSALVD